MIDAGIKMESANPENNICELFACQCMPTLYQVKPASLIAVDKRRFSDTQEFYSRIKKCLDQYSCSLIPFQETESRLYLFLYSEQLLWHAMTAGMRQSFLERYGYPVQKDQIANALSLLGKRYRSYWVTGKFPHEIGIFLGYPLADVEGFIYNSGRNYILCGMWKVYQRVKVAEAAFLCFHQLKARAVELSRRSNLSFQLQKEASLEYSQILWELLDY